MLHIGTNGHKLCPQPIHGGCMEAYDLRIDKDQEMKLNQELIRQNQASVDPYPDMDFTSLRDLVLSYPNKKVLIVEDDLTQMNILEELLLEINPDLEIDWETNAESAIQRIAKSHAQFDTKHYDMVISDIALDNGSSGVELLKYCSEYEPQLETILITSYSSKNLKKYFFKQVEPLDYIQKPIDFTIFYRKVAPHLVTE
jgi:CheY-like chemotaxis protein